MDEKLLNILVCPVTKGPLIYDKKNNELISRSAKLAIVPVVEHFCYSFREYQKDIVLMMMKVMEERRRLQGQDLVLLDRQQVEW